MSCRTHSSALGGRGAAERRRLTASAGASGGDRGVVEGLCCREGPAGTTDWAWEVELQTDTEESC